MNTTFVIILIAMAITGGYIGGRIHAASADKDMDEALVSLGQTALLIKSYMIILGDLSARYREVAQKATLSLPDSESKKRLELKLQTLDSEMETYAASIEDYISSKEG